MPIAAVPAYLGSDFYKAPPGHRFSLYLRFWGVDQRDQQPLWTTHDLKDEVRGQDRQERVVKVENKVPAFREALKLTDKDRATLNAIVKRQSVLAAALELTGQLSTFAAESIAPFTTGLGIQHPLENGFAFLNPYGLPYLPGSGVKGVLRRAAQELVCGLFGDDQEGWTLDAIRALFGTEEGETDADGKELPRRRGALMFWDVIPDLKDGSLKLEIMTPHQSAYYQGTESPHDSGSPNPICFLSVPPGSGFNFHIQCNQPFLARIAPELAEQDLWRKLLQAAFLHAFNWIGFGAKTAVGYGAMELLAERERIAAERKARQEAAYQDEQEQKLKERLQTWENVEVVYDRPTGNYSAQGPDGRRAVAQSTDASKLRASLPQALQDKFKNKGKLKLTIEVDVEGNKIVIHAIKLPTA